MIQKDEFKKYTIFEDTHQGCLFRIKLFDQTNSNHYCGYVRLPEDSEYVGQHYDDIPIKVHGGLTFAEFVGNEFWIGWDYLHSGDKNKNFELIDIIKGCCSVIMQLL